MNHDKLRWFLVYCAVALLAGAIVFTLSLAFVDDTRALIEPGWIRPSW